MNRRNVWLSLMLVVGLAGTALAQDTTTTTTTTTDASTDGTSVTTVEQGSNAGSSTTTTRSSGTSHSESSSESSSSGGSVSGGGVSISIGTPFVRHSGPRAAGGNSCSVPDNHQCKGCAISCPSDKAASCKPGDRGIFTGDNDGLCPTDAKCVCK